MGFFALLLLIVVVAISVDRLRESQDIRQEASVICPNGQCDPDNTDGSLAQMPMVSLQPQQSGPQYLYNFYDYDVDPPVLHNLKYKLSYTTPIPAKTGDELILTLTVPANADNAAFVLNSNLNPALSLDRQEQVIGDTKEITLSFSGLLPHWQTGNTTLELGTLQTRPTKLGQFTVAIPADKNSFITVAEGNELQSVDILPSSIFTNISLEPSSVPNDTYALQFTMKNINQEMAINPRRSSIWYYPPRNTSEIPFQSTDLPILNVGDEFTTSVSISKALEIKPEVGGKFLLFSAVTTLLQDITTFEITQEVLDQANAKIFYDLSFVGKIRNEFSLSTDFPLEYELQIINSTNETTTPVAAKFVVLEISSSQPGVTISTHTHSDICEPHPLRESVLQCIFPTVGVITPIQVQISGAKSGNISFENKLAVIGNPERELDTTNNLLTLNTVVVKPTEKPFRMADIWPIGNPDRKVDSLDYGILVDNFNKRNTDSDWNSAADINKDGWISLDDYIVLVNQFAPTGY